MKKGEEGSGLQGATPSFFRIGKNKNLKDFYRQQKSAMFSFIGYPQAKKFSEEKCEPGKKDSGLSPKPAFQAKHRKSR